MCLLSFEIPSFPFDFDLDPPQHVLYIGVHNVSDKTPRQVFRIRLIYYYACIMLMIIIFIATYENALRPRTSMSARTFVFS